MTDEYDLGLMSTNVDLIFHSNKIISFLTKNGQTRKRSSSHIEKDW